MFAAARLAALTLASASALGALAVCEREGCEQAVLLQITKSDSDSAKSLWPFSSLVQDAAQHEAELDQKKLEEVHKVHADMEALAKQKLVELESRNLSDYNLTQEDFGLSNSTLTLLDTVLTEMDSLLSQINASHLADEQLLLDLAQGFVQCNTDLAARQVESNNLSSLVNDASDSHDNCRSTEQNLSAQNASAWEAYLSKANESQPQEVLDCLQNFHNAYSPQTIDLVAHLQAMIDCATTLQSWSTAFVANVTGLRDAYFGSLHAVNNHSENCRVNQSTLESHFCEYRQQLTDSCFAMDDCYQNVNETFHELLVTIAASDSRREASFIAATKVVCYIQVLKANLTQPAVQACQDLVVDTAGLDVRIPVPATKHACDTSPVADYPCSMAWQQEEYYDKNWYSGTPQIEPDTCISCAVWNAPPTTTAPNAWELLLDGSGPPPRAYAAMCAGSGGKVYLFGGSNGTASEPGRLNDTWVLDLSSTPSWTKVNVAPGSAPDERNGVTMVCTGDSLLVFGGKTPDNVQQNDLWKLTLANSTWEKLMPSGTLPPTRFLHTAVWNPDGQTMLVYAGHWDLDDLWSYNLTSNSWTQLLSDPLGSRYDHVAVWNPVDKIMLVSGGSRRTPAGNVDWFRSNDLMSYDPATNTWKELIPHGTLTAPQGRHRACAVWNTAAQAMVLFGGSNGSNLNDTWEYKAGSNWTELVPTASPSTRRAQQCAWASTQATGGVKLSSTIVRFLQIDSSKVMVVFSGYGSDYLADTWQYAP